MLLPLAASEAAADERRLGSAEVDGEMLLAAFLPAVVADLALVPAGATPARWLLLGLLLLGAAKNSAALASSSDSGGSALLLLPLLGLATTLEGLLPGAVPNSCARASAAAVLSTTLGFPAARVGLLLSRGDAPPELCSQSQVGQSIHWVDVTTGTLQDWPATHTQCDGMQLLSPAAAGSPSSGSVLHCNSRMETGSWVRPHHLHVPLLVLPWQTPCPCLARGCCC